MPLMPAPTTITSPQLSCAGLWERCATSSLTSAIPQCPRQRLALPKSLDPVLSPDCLWLRNSGDGVQHLLQSKLVDQRFHSDLDVTRAHGCFVDFLFPFFVNQGVVQTPFHAQRFGERRLVFAHVTFQRQTGIGFLEQVSGRTRGPAEITFVVFLAVDDVLVPAGTFRRGVLTREDGKVDVPQRLMNDPNPRPRRVVA